MNAKKLVKVFVIPILLVTGCLLAVDVAENVLIEFGIVNPVVAALGTVPIVTATLLVLIIWILRKQKIADVV